MIAHLDEVRGFMEELSQSQFLEKELLMIVSGKLFLIVGYHF